MRSAVLGLIAVLVAAPCKGQNTSVSDDPEVVDGYVLSGEAEGAPEGCDVRTVGARVEEFFTAIKEGDPNVGDRFFAPRSEPLFAWFSFSDVETGLAYSTSESTVDLNMHFIARHQAGNRLKLRGIDVNGWVPERNSIGFVLFFDYFIASPQLKEDERRRGFGKAEYHCPTSEFIVMSLGLTEESQWQELFAIHLGSSSSRRR